MDIESDLPQDYEQIPWSHLVPPQKDRSLQLAAIAVVIIAIFLAIVFFMRRTPAIHPIVASTTAAPAVVEAAPPEVPAAVSVPITSTPDTGPRIYSEADLMAVLPPPVSDRQLEAIARAEWFVTDYFTVDGDAALGDAVNAILPDVVDLPRTDGATISYVEWARAVEAIDSLDGEFEVTVWFRTLVGTVDAGFSRTAVRAVRVRLTTDDQGRLAVADVPTVADLSPAGIGPAWPVPETPPVDLLSEAAQQLEGFGLEPELQAAGETGDGWRFVFSVGDASGLRFPIAVRIP